ncbi:MAG: hypothetical protein MI923_21455 [Phycisphaerales bacterium]|nr:hypothetical protein [Phycisphaerales bacterium]
MATSVTDLRSHLTAARAALARKDYANAELEALQAQAVLAGVPDIEMESGVKITWRQTITELLESIRQSKRTETASKKGIQRTKVRFLGAT